MHQLQVKTDEGVKNTAKGIEKAEQGVQLAYAVKDALGSILDSATRSSNRVADTVQVIQQTIDSRRTISASMKRVTEMVMHIRQAIQEEEQDIEQVMSKVGNISGMAGQVRRSSIEQRKAAAQIVHSMEDADRKFHTISGQTETLERNLTQIGEAMRTIDSTTDQSLENAAEISGETVKNLIFQSELLQNIVSVFK